MKTLAVIPARYGSTRFPGKPLAMIHGKPVIQYVFENAAHSDQVDDVVVATDHEDIFNVVRKFGGNAQMTRTDLPSGSDRVAEVAKRLMYDIIVNVQGDEPLLTPDMISGAVAILKTSDAHVGTLATRIRDPKDMFDPNIVKTVFDLNYNALYFSRAPIPFYRGKFLPSGERFQSFDASSPFKAYKHIGIYSYRRNVLLDLTALPPSDLENAEKLEQLRALENGYTIKISITDKDTVGVDTPGDLERVREWLSTSL